MRTGTILLSVFFAMALILSISGCGKQQVSEGQVENTGSAEVSVAGQSDNRQEENNTNISDSSTANGKEVTQEDLPADTKEDSEAMLQMRIGDTPVAVDWEDNESVQALRDLCTDTPIIIQMSMYGGFEQVGSIGSSLPRNDVQTKTDAGDIVLYSGNQIVVFYGSNSWAYTRLGHITDKDQAGMADLLGNGDVTITIGME